MLKLADLMRIIKLEKRAIEFAMNDFRDFTQQIHQLPSQLLFKILKSIDFNYYIMNDLK